MSGRQAYDSDVARDWITLIAALAGAGVGAVAAYANQAVQWRRQQAVRWDATRREVYGRFLARLNAYFLTLSDLSWAIRKRSPQLDARGEQARLLLAELLATKGEVDIVASTEVQAAADAAVEHVAVLNRRLYEARSDLGTASVPGLPKAHEYEAEFSPIRANFVRAVKDELALTRR